MPESCTTDQKRKTDKQNPENDPKNSAAKQRGEKQSKTDSENQNAKRIPPHIITSALSYAGADPV